MKLGRSGGMLIVESYFAKLKKLMLTKSYLLHHVHVYMYVYGIMQGLARETVHTG
jgi:hypothetical protein